METTFHLDLEKRNADDGGDGVSSPDSSAEMPCLDALLSSVNPHYTKRPEIKKDR